MPRKGGLGRNLNDLYNSQQFGVTPTDSEWQPGMPWDPKYDRLVLSPEARAARDAWMLANPDWIEQMQDRYGRPGQLIPGRREPESEVFGIGYEDMEAPTTNSAFPRARILGYNRATETLVIIFRDQTWVMYENIPEELWDGDNGIVNTDSVGKYLAANGIDNWPAKKRINGSGELPRTPKQSYTMGLND